MEVFFLFRFLIVVGAVLAVAEILASLFWLPFYFRRGIRLYHRNVSGCFETNRNLTEVTSCSNTGFLFQPIGADEIALRDPLISFSFRRTPMLHGTVSYDGSKVQVLGLANWTPLPVVILFILFGSVVIVEIGFLGLAGLLVLAMPAAFIAFWASAIQRQRARLDDLVDELIANLKTNDPKSR